MSRLNIRQFKRDLSSDGSTYTPSKPWDLHANSTIDGGAIASTSYVTTAVAQGAHTHVDAYCYIDAARAGETYVETGSEVAPYRSLTQAVTDKLTDANTDLVVFKLAPGDYIGTISVVQAARNQSFAIHGSGSEKTFIQGSGAWDATVGDVLYFRLFNNIEVRDVTIKLGKYGLYTRDTHAVHISGCRFEDLGTDGTDHDLSTSDATQAALWNARGTAGAHRSDGGAMRIQQGLDIRISNCTVDSTLRCYRIQDCTGGQIINCNAKNCLESAYYLASGSYTASAGCTNFQIVGCKASEIFHQPVLVIGGSNNTVQGCTFRRCANGGVVAWHTQDLKILGNTFDECNISPYRGIGGYGDSYSQVFQQNKEDMAAADTGGYALTCLHNVFTRCGQGRESAVYTFFFMEDWVDSVASFRVVIDGNNSDAAIQVKNDTSVPLVSTAYPAPAAGGLSGATVDRVMVTDGNGDAAVSAVTSQTLSYLDPTSGIQSQIDDCAKTDSAPTFTGQVTCPKFYIYDNNGEDALFTMMTDNAASTFKIEHRTTNIRWKFGGDTKYYIYLTGRHKFEGMFLQVPEYGVQTATAGNSKGGIFLDTTTSPPLLKYHDGVQWKTLATV